MLILACKHTHILSHPASATQLHKHVPTKSNCTWQNNSFEKPKSNLCFWGVIIVADVSGHWSVDNNAFNNSNNDIVVILVQNVKISIYQSLAPYCPMGQSINQNGINHKLMNE